MRKFTQYLFLISFSLLLVLVAGEITIRILGQHDIDGNFQIDLLGHDNQ